MTVPVPGELPDTMPIWKVQQRRWAKGFGEVMLRVLGSILRDARLSLHDRFAALLHVAHRFIDIDLPFGPGIFAATSIRTCGSSESSKASSDGRASASGSSLGKIRSGASVNPIVTVRRPSAIDLPVRR